MDVDLSVKIGTIALKNPIILASGPKGGKSGEGMKKFAKAGWGAVVAKTVTKEASKGFPNPTIVNFRPHYTINAQGGPNVGYIAFAEEVRIAKEGGVPVFVSIAAPTPEEFVLIGKHLIAAGADGIEVNASCPHTPGRAKWSSSSENLELLIRSIRREIEQPIWVKLPSTRMADIPRLAEAAAKGGADAVIPFNTVPGMSIDINTGKPRVGNPHGVGSISGKAVKPMGVRAVLDAVRVVDIPIIGVGGIEDGLDVVEYFMAGASAVQIHTKAMWEGEGVIDKILDETRQFMIEKGYRSIRDMVGLTLKYVPKLPFSYIEGL